MKTQHLGIYALAGIVAAGFAYGVAQLLILRYASGDMYPPYSSLRADPLGVKALYDGIDRLRDFSCARNYKPFPALRDLSQTTIFYVGVEVERFRYAADTASVEAAEQIVSNGGRLVISLLPVSGSFKADEVAAPRQESPSDEQAQDRKDEEQKHIADLAARWGVEIRAAAASDSAMTARYSGGQAAQFPASISWHSRAYFAPRDNAWRVVYRRDGHPALIEKASGRGTIVLAADSYFLSNEAMRNERHPQLLAWLAGGNPRILFDETHFGVMESPGIAALIRKYRLSGFVAALVALALLFAWKNAVSFAPPPEERQTEGRLSGKDMMSGLVNVLRRNIPASKIARVCFEEWKKTCARNDDHERDARIAALMQAEDARPARERDAAAFYRAMCEILKKT